MHLRTLGSRQVHQVQFPKRNNCYNTGTFS
jgi:hypothetical protein